MGEIWDFGRAPHGARGLYYDQPGSGGKRRSVHAALSDLPVNVKMFGAKGDGATDDTTAIQNAINYVSGLGGGTVRLPAATYAVSSVLTLASGVRLEGEGPGRTKFLKLNSMQYINATGSWDATQANTLASDVAAGATSITLAAGKGANITAGSWVVLLSDGLAPGGASVTHTMAEFVNVHSVATDTLTLSSPLRAGYTVANSAEVQNITWVEDIAIVGIGFDGANFLAPGSVNAENVIILDRCLRPVIENCGAWNLPNFFAGLRGCLGARVSDLYGRDFQSNGILGDTDSFGYGLVELGLNEGLVADNITMERVRHAYTTATGGLSIGVPTGSRITNGVAMSCRGAGWDTHPVGTEITFVNCVVMGSLGHGFQIRSVGTQVIGCTVRDTLGAAVNISSDARRTKINDFSAIKTNHGTFNATDWSARGAVFDDGEYTTVDGVTLDVVQGPAVSLGANADFGLYVNIRGVNLRQGGTGEGFLVGTSGPTEFTARNVDLSGNLNNGFAVSAATVTDGRFIDCEARGGSSTKFAITGGALCQVFTSGGIYAGAGGTRKNVSIVTGAIDIEAMTSSYVRVDGEGGLADDLVTITGGTEGTPITITKGAGVITVKHGLGNIYLDGSVDVALSNARDNIRLLNIAGTWVENGRGIA